MMLQCFEMLRKIHGRLNIYYNQKVDLIHLKDFLRVNLRLKISSFFQTAEDYREVAIITINHHLKEQHFGENKKDPGSLKEGYLTKRGGPMNSMRRRYCVLKQDILHVYRDRLDSDIELSIDLKIGIKIKDVQVQQTGFRFQFSVQVRGEAKKHVFSASDGKQREGWKQAIRIASKLDDDNEEEKEERPDVQQYWALKRGEGGPRPLIGKSWRTELVAYALQIYFVYIDEDGFAHLNLPTLVSTRITNILCKDLEKEEKAVIRSSDKSISPMTISPITSSPSITHSQGPLNAFEDIELENAGTKSSLVEKSKSNSDNQQREESIPGVTQHLVQVAAKIARYLDIQHLPNLFTDAQEEIFNLMQRDPFRRYVRSHLYREWIEPEEEEIKRVRLMQQTIPI